MDDQMDSVNDNNPIPAWHRLPRHLLELMLKDLPRQSAAAIRLTCRLFRDSYDSSVQHLRVSKPPFGCGCGMQLDLQRLLKRTVQVTHLRMWDCKDFDITPAIQLAMPRLLSLEIWSFPADGLLSLVRHAQHLQALQVTGCAGDVDASAFSAVTTLTRLQITGQQSPLMSLEPLTALKALQHIWFYSEQQEYITSFAALKQLRALTLLDLQNCYRVADISPLSVLTGLRKLSLSNGGMTDARPLSRLTNLTSLYLAGHPEQPTAVQNHTSLRTLTCLQQLTLSHARITGGNAAKLLQPLRRLKSLHLDSTKIFNHQGLEMLTHLSDLESLNISTTQVNDLSPLSALSKLHDLHIERLHHGIDIEPLTALTQLTGLSLYNSRVISGFEILGRMPQLKELDIEGIGLKDISTFSNLVNLEVLYADHNPIEKGIMELTVLTKLGLLSLGGVDVLEQEKYALSKMPQLELHLAEDDDSKPNSSSEEEDEQDQGS